jgi:hypothetical protein
MHDVIDETDLKKMTELVEQFTHLRLFEGTILAVTHGADFDTLLFLSVPLFPIFLENPVVPLSVKVDRLGRIGQVRQMDHRLQHLQQTILKRRQRDVDA